MLNIIKKEKENLKEKMNICKKIKDSNNINQPYRHKINEETRKKLEAAVVMYMD